MNEKISIVTVVMNRRNDLQRTIQSVIAQDYQFVEFIIQDGGSTDGTVELVREHQAYINHFRSGRDSGIYDAMNKALDLVTGEWVIFMNAGDVFYSNDVLTRIFQLETYKADILYGDALVQYEHYTLPFARNDLRNMWKKSPFSHQSAFIRSELMKEYRYDITYKIGADHEFFYRAYKNGKRFEFINQTICLFDGRSGATKKHIIVAIKDKMNIALRYEPSMGKWVYYQLFLVYAHVSSFIKKVLGNNLTQIISKPIRKLV